MTEMDLLEIIAHQVVTLTSDMSSLKKDMRDLKDDVQELKKGHRKLEEGQLKLEKNQQRIESELRITRNEVRKTNYIIENEIRPDIKALHESFVKNTNKIAHIEEQFQLKSVQ